MERLRELVVVMVVLVVAEVKVLIQTVLLVVLEYLDKVMLEEHIVHILKVDMEAVVLIKLVGQVEEIRVVMEEKENLLL